MNNKNVNISDYEYIVSNTHKNVRICDINLDNKSNKTYTVIEGIRSSDRGKYERIYIVLNEPCNHSRHDTISYITKTTNGYGGTGKLNITNISEVCNGMIMSTADIIVVNEKQRIPMWVGFKNNRYM